MINQMGLPGLLLIVIVGLGAVVVPFWRLLPKFGIPAWLSLVSVIPLGALILLWVIAFVEPLDRKEVAA